MKKFLILIAIIAFLIAFSFQRIKKNVYSHASKVSEKEEILIGCLKESVNSIEERFRSENDSVLLNKLAENILFVKDYQDHIADFQLCDKIFEIDSIIIASTGFKQETKTLLFVNNCKKEISEYNNSLNIFFNSSIWVRNRLIRKGEIKNREYFEYLEYKLENEKPSKKRTKLNADLDSLMLEGLKKK